MYPKRKIQMIMPTKEENLRFEFLKYVGKHRDNSQLFFPGVSIIPPRSILNENWEGGLLTEEKLMKSESYRLMLKAKETGEKQGIDFHILADGRKAYIERV
jgi:hypothetical protein